MRPAHDCLSCSSPDPFPSQPPAGGGAVAAGAGGLQRRRG
ncbi:MAG: MYXO-CTERM sorting domain-containing protein [Achromobacter piechaudii]